MIVEQWRWMKQAICVNAVEKCMKENVQSVDGKWKKLMKKQDI